MPSLATNKSEMRHIWLDRKGVMFDPRRVVFPPYCIFTGQPIHDLTPVNLIFAEGILDVTLLPADRVRLEFPMPVSYDWLRKSADRMVLARKIIMGASVAILWLSLIAVILLIYGEAPFGTISLAGGIPATIAIGALLGLVFATLKFGPIESANMNVVLLEPHGYLLIRNACKEYRNILSGELKKRFQQDGG